MPFSPALLCSLLSLLCIASDALATPAGQFFFPSDADPAITQYNSYNIAFTDPAVTHRGLLVIFLPGTGATPSGDELYLQNAASLGFHALGLMYPNGQSIGSLCGKYAPDDPDANGNVRLEVIDGVDVCSFVSVDQTNCIVHRLLMALQYLDAHDPAGDWGQFYSGSTVLWSKIVACGHSQGAGMAGVIAKTRVVARCIMYTDLNWWDAGSRPCNWVYETPQTPMDRWYFMAHERDQICPFALMPLTVSALDVNRYGDYVLVETSPTTTYSNRHYLATNLEPDPSQAGQYHQCVVNDAATPKQADGTPVLKPAWNYMLLHETQPITIEQAGDSLIITFSPGTLEQSNDLITWNQQPDVQSPLSIPLKNLGVRSFVRLSLPAQPAAQTQAPGVLKN